MCHIKTYEKSTSILASLQVGRCELTLYILSNSYIGLDQQYDICLDVIEASLETQLNTEVITEEEVPAPRPGLLQGV